MRLGDKGFELLMGYRVRTTPPQEIATHWLCDGCGHREKLAYPLQVGIRRYAPDWCPACDTKRMHAAR